MCCSLSNYSSGGESSRHSSLDDSGVFNDDGGIGGGGGEGDKLRVQMPPEGGDVINYQQGRKPSRINIPFVVSIGEKIVSGYVVQICQKG